MKFPDNLRYTSSHLWLRKEPDNSLSLGLTPQALASLGEIAFVELPGIGRVFEEGEEIALVESVKASLGIPAPLAGEVLAVNGAASKRPASLNSEPYQIWLLRFRPRRLDDIDTLLDARAYARILALA